MAGYYFNLPNVDSLTIPQQSALDETRPIALTGGPGTGKSVVSLWRHIRNYELDLRKSVLLTYTKTLCTYLKNTCAAQRTGNDVLDFDDDDPAVDNIAKSLSWGRTHYDEIIVDEAQDLSVNFYQGLAQFARWGVSYGADDNQILFPEQCSTEEHLRRLFPRNVLKDLDENFRNTYEIIYFAKELFSDFRISQNTLDTLLDKDQHGPMPQLLIHNDDLDKQNTAIFDIIDRYNSDTHNIAILVPFKSNVHNYHDIISAHYPHLNCSKYCNDMDECNIENIHITTFKSAKGLEFDTVIIPDFDRFQYNIRHMDVVSEKDYYVAITRARRNLFLISSEHLLYIDNSTYEEEVLI